MNFVIALLPDGLLRPCVLPGASAFRCKAWAYRRPRLYNDAKEICHRVRSSAFRRLSHIPFSLALGFILVVPFLSSQAQQPSDDPVKNEQIDRSIDRALDYLSKNQRLDGSFEQQYGETAAIPALVGMAFLAKGNVPGEGH